METSVLGSWRERWKFPCRITFRKSRTFSRKLAFSSIVIGKKGKSTGILLCTMETR
jgi:hypothetical protein